MIEHRATIKHFNVEVDKKKKVDEILKKNNRLNYIDVFKEDFPLINL